VTFFPCCISKRGEYIRADVGPGRPSEILECYRSLVSAALEQKFHEIGVPAGFKLAFVPLTYSTLNGYRHAEIEARKRGIRAKVFMEEVEAIRWLTQPDRH
jgi:hypothetical protein